MEHKLTKFDIINRAKIEKMGKFWFSDKGIEVILKVLTENKKDVIKLRV